MVKKPTIATKRKRQEPEVQGLIRLQVYCIILQRNAHSPRSLAGNEVEGELVGKNENETAKILETFIRALPCIPG